MSNEENPHGHPADQQGHAQQQEFPPDPQGFVPQQQGFPPGHGGWQPTPQGEYDAEATAFVQLPPEDTLHAAPLEAPGHGYVPPMILPLTPAAEPQITGGGWHGHTGHPDPAAHPGHTGHPAQGAGEHDPHATGQWVFSEAEQQPPPPMDVTGQWTIPVARGDLPEETGEFTASMLQSQWNSAPATLPGGAPAPWATEPPATLPGGAPAPWAQDALPEAQQPEAGTGLQEPAVTAPAEHAEPVGPAAYADQAHQTEQAEQAAQTELTDQTEQTEYAEQTDYTQHTEHAARPEAVEPHPEHAGHDGHAEHTDRPEYADHPGHPEQAEHAPYAEPVEHPGHTEPVAAPDLVAAELPDAVAEPAVAAGPAEPAVAGEPEAVPPAGEQAPEPEPEPATLSAPADEAAPAPGSAAEPAPEAGGVTAPEAGPDSDSPPGTATTAVSDASAVTDTVNVPDTVTESPAEPGAESGPGAESESGPAPADPAPADGPAPHAADDPADAPPGQTAAVPAPVIEEHPPTSYVLRVNGTDRPVTDAWIGESLLYVLRERLGLAGAKDGCSQGECGACNVQVDGRLVASCLVPAATAAGTEVRTVEGLAADGEPSDVQRALAACGAVQCGFCIPGMAMTVHDLLEGNHSPTELETRQALCGNLCRCSGYRGVLDAVRDVVAEREASAAAAAESGESGRQEARIPHQAPPGAGSVQPHPHDGGMA
ncbi:2Fe-2S iron-sulfur cluster-binding protein [Streptomyces sp. NPDC004609]|uniref:2Fe-2S iron-sulfur cluster-binding protein n=1 Tax=Streptomyces sp. NPDC004609 TaxID=3364704 RepID=UPI00368896EF